MVDVDRLLELEAKANHSVNIRLYDNAGWWEGMTEDDGKLFVAMRNSIRDLCLEVKALREVAKAARALGTPGDFLISGWDLDDVFEALKKLDEARRDENR